MPRLCEVYPGICRTTEEKARKILSQEGFHGGFSHFLQSQPSLETLQEDDFRRRVMLPSRTASRIPVSTAPHLTTPA